jgi:hypothetical protein
MILFCYYFIMFPFFFFALKVGGATNLRAPTVAPPAVAPPTLAQTPRDLLHLSTFRERIALGA